MFTIDQIKAAHASVKSGADFPSYIKAISALGVTHYEAYVADGRIDYHGEQGFTAKGPAQYAFLPIAEFANLDEFKTQLKAHQQGKTDFLMFIHMCAACGIEKWDIWMNLMTCTYFDLNGNEVLVEKIPE